MPQKQNSLFVVAFTVFLLAALVSCQTFAPKSPFAKTWRTVLDMPDGGLPFHIEITDDDGALSAAVRNGAEALPFTTVDVDGETIKLVFEHYNAWFEGRIDAAGETITGDWKRRRGKEISSQVAFVAQAGIADRFDPIDEQPAAPSPIDDVTGKWDFTFGEGEETWRSLGIFEQDGHKVTGTFLTKVGDFRYLEGTFEKGTLRLSVFDGCHSFLVCAQVVAEGVLEGTFWFGSSGTPIRAVAGGTPMADPWSLTRCVSEAGTFSFSFPDADGNILSSSDARFEGKPLVVCVIGTWCCNCYDAGRLLAELYEEYHSKGLEIVCLCSEASGDLETDGAMMRAFSRCWDAEWPLLHVGSSSKNKTLEALPDLDVFLSYPTTIFIDREGTVRKIHTGFTGPGTGEYYERMCAEFRGVIEGMLAE